MFTTLISTFLSIAGIGYGQTLYSCKTLQSSNDFYMVVALDFNTSLATIQLQGPSDVWFGVGWDSDEMPDTYATIGLEDEVVERTLGSNSGGTELDSSIIISVFVDTSDSVRTVTFVRALAADSSSYYNFSTVTEDTEIDIIWAVGSSLTFAQHASRGSTTWDFADDPDCYDSDSGSRFGTYLPVVLSVLACMTRFYV